MSSSRGPVALMPEGPLAWGSFGQLQPVVLRALKGAGAKVVRRSPFGPPGAKVGGSAWILPYGALTLGGLRLADILAREWSGKRPPLWIMTNGEGAKACLHLLAARAALSNHDELVVTCEAEARLIREAFPGTRPRVAPLPVDTARFKPLSTRARREIKAHLGLGSGDPLVIYAGRLSFQKNVLGLVEAFARMRRTHPRARLLILGQVDPMFLPHLGRAFGQNIAQLLMRDVARLELGEAVRFSGPVGQPQLARYLGACDAHASLTTHFGEDFGYSIAQGLAAGAPTVITRWGGGAEFVRSGAALGVPVAFDARDELPRVDLKAAARLLAQAITRGAELRERAASHAKSELSPAACAARWTRWLAERPRSHSYEPSARARWFLEQSEETEALYPGPRDPYYRRVCSVYAGQR